MSRLRLLVTDPRRVARAIARRLFGLRQAGATAIGDQTVASYWTGHNVTSHEGFPTAAASLEYFEWRNDQYPGYIELMPVTGQDGRVVLDYGCGPGNDLVGFAVYSRPARLIGMDVSPTSLDEARRRVALHGVTPDLFHLDERSTRLPLDDASVDHVHSSGVLHHIPDPLPVLREFHRVLRPGGSVRIMVYNHDSVWMHLRAAYLMRALDRRFSGMDLAEVFRRSTDGENCPVSRAYTPSAFCQLAQSAGFRATFLGAAVSLTELEDLRQKRWEAVSSRALPAEHRRFLTELRLDDRGIPMHGGAVAGIDACFSLVK